MTRPTLFFVSLAFLLPGVLSSQPVSLWTLKEDLRLGAGPEGFSWISDLEVLPDGSMVVSQPLEHELRVYDQQGLLLRRIGRSGAGPGEFRRIDSLGYRPRGVLVLDRAQGRLSQISVNGDFVQQWGPPAHQYEPGLIGTPPVGFLRDGSWLVIPEYRAPPGEESRRLPVLQFGSDGRFLRTLGHLFVGDHTRRAQAGNLVSFIPQPVSTHSLWSILRDGSGVVIVHRAAATTSRAGEFRILRIGVGGDTVFSRVYRVPSVRVPKEAAARILDTKIDETARSRPFPRAQIARLYADGWRVPEYQAPVDRVIAGLDGSIWIREGAFAADSATWRVFDDNGEYVARLHADASLHVFRASREHLWGVQYGDFDEPLVVRLRVERS